MAEFTTPSRPLAGLASRGNPGVCAAVSTALTCPSATTDGRLSLLGRSFSTTRGSEHQQQELGSDEEVWDCLRTHFGIEIDA